MLGMLINLLVAEKSGMSAGENTETAQLKVFADQMTAKVMETAKEKAKDWVKSALPDWQWSDYLVPQS